MGSLTGLGLMMGISGWIGSTLNGLLGLSSTGLRLRFFRLCSCHFGEVFGSPRLFGVWGRGSAAQYAVKMEQLRTRKG